MELIGTQVQEVVDQSPKKQKRSLIASQNCQVVSQVRKEYQGAGMAPLRQNHNSQELSSKLEMLSECIIKILKKTQKPMVLKLLPVVLCMCYMCLHVICLRENFLLRALL